jgi:hypothetical protein
MGAGASSLETLQNTLHLRPIWVPLSLLPTPSQWGEWGFWANVIRVPSYALFLGLMGMLLGPPSPRRGYFIFLSVFSIIMALGPYVGLWKIVHSLPGLTQLRFPFWWVFLLPICVSFFCAHGIDHLLSLPTGFPPKVRRGLKSLLIVGLAAGAIFLLRYKDEMSTKTRMALENSLLLTGLLLLCAVGMIIGAFVSLRPGAARRGVLLGVTSTVISLFASIAFAINDPMVIRSLSAIGWKENNPPSGPQMFRTATDLSPYDVWMKNAIRRHYNYTPNLTVLNGTLTTGHYFSLFPYWSANMSTWSQEALKGNKTKQVYLNLGSARQLFRSDESIFENVGFAGEESLNRAKIYENQNAVSRAMVVSSYRLFDDEGALIEFLESSTDFDPRRDMVILRRDAEAWNLRAYEISGGPTTIPPKATIVVERPDRLEIELDRTAPNVAFLVLSDTFYPGWKASVDGVNQEVLRVNYAFRGVQLPGGSKRVVFTFDPLIPDGALPLPTFFLFAVGVSVLLRHYLNRSGSVRKNSQSIGRVTHSEK